MPALTRSDVEDVMMQTEENQRAWKQESDTQFEGPLTDSLVAAVWQGMPPNMKQWYRINMPEASKKMDKLFGGR